jgi:hypothetical protein
LKLGGVSAEHVGAKFPMANFEIEQQKIHDASEYATALDDYQHKTCEIPKAAPKRRCRVEKAYWYTSRHPSTFDNFQFHLNSI